MKYAFCTVAIVAILHANAFAAVKYWDVNGATAGSGVVAASTTNWATNNWSTDLNGGTATGGFTSATDAAVFAAGTDGSVAYTVNLGSALTSTSVTVEEGTVTKTGAALSVQNITVNNGAGFFINSSGALTVAAGGICLLNGGTIGNSNTGTNGSFLGNSSANTNMKISLGTGGGHVSANGGSGILTIYTGLIDGTGPLTVDGNGIFRLTTTTATYTGATIVNGTFQLTSTANTLPSGTDLTINSGGKFDYQSNQTVASLSGSGSLVGTSPSVLTIGGTSSTVYSGVWSGNGRINVNKSGGTGTLTLDGINTSTGQFTLTAGTVTVNSGKALCSAVCDVFVNGGTLNLNNTSQTIENLAGTGGQINVTSGLSLTSDPIASTLYTGIIAGAGGLTRLNANSSARTLTLSGANTYDGNTIITNGIISVQNNTALGSTVGYTEVNQTGGTIAAELLFTSAAGSVTTSEPLRITGAGTSSDGGVIAVTAGASPTISGPVTLIGDSTIAVSSSSSVLYNNANSFTSAANQNLTLEGGSGASPLGIGTISGAIALGDGSLTKLQGGTWVLSGSNSYNGATSINDGKLSVGNVGNSGSNSNLGTNGTINMGATATTGTLVYTGAGETSNKVINLAGTTGGATIDQSGAGNLKFTSDLTTTGNGAKTLRLQGSTAGTGEIAGKIVDSASATSLAKSGTGTWVLSGTSVYSGTTTVSGGTLLVNGSTTGTGAVSVTSATLGGTGSIAGAVAAGTGGNISPGTAATPISTFAVGALTFNAGSTFTYDLNSDSLTGDLLSVNGALAINAGALAVNDLGSTILVGTKFTLINYVSGLPGAFDTLPEGSTVTTPSGNEFVLSYDDPGGVSGVNVVGSLSGHYVTLTAVPEANAFWLGGAICLVLGLTVGTRKMIGNRTAA